MNIAFKNTISSLAILLLLTTFAMAEAPKQQPVKNQLVPWEYAFYDILPESESWYSGNQQIIEWGDDVGQRRSNILQKMNLSLPHDASFHC